MVTHIPQSTKLKLPDNLKLFKMESKLFWQTSNNYVLSMDFPEWFLSWKWLLQRKGTKWCSNMQELKKYYHKSMIQFVKCWKYIQIEINAWSKTFLSGYCFQATFVLPIIIIPIKSLGGNPSINLCSHVLFFSVQMKEIYLLLCKYYWK